LSAEVVTVFGLLAAAVVLFATQRMPVDLVALLLMSALLLRGILTPAEGVAGFSNIQTL
jgi:di/tricarboxylate transporter